MMMRKYGNACHAGARGRRSSELAQAALKLARVLRAENPTPVTLEEAKMNLTAEFTDDAALRRRIKTGN